MQWRIVDSCRAYDSPRVGLRVDDVELPSGARIEPHVIEFPKPSVRPFATDELGQQLHQLPATTTPALRNRMVYDP